MTGSFRSRWRIALLAAMILALSPVAVSAELSTIPDAAVAVQCNLPGQVIEAGETARYDLNLVNRGEEVNRLVWYESFQAVQEDWAVTFVQGDIEITKISLPTEGKMTITALVETSSDTPPGDYSVRLHVGDGWYWVYLTISKSHAGEKGTLELSVVDKDGEKVKGATVGILPVDGDGAPDQVMSTADGSVSTELEQGLYDLLISKAGYKEVEKKEVRIKGGIATDAGTVMLEKALYAADITMRSTVIIANLGDNPTYEMTLANIGRSDDTYRLGVGDAPEGWYVRYRESGAQTADISEIFVRSGEEKTLVVEAIPPYGTAIGSYNVTLVIDSATASYDLDLTSRMRGSHDLRVYAEQYQYDVNKGGVLDFNLTLTNAGDAGTLTNVKVAVTAPDGWSADVDPGTIAGIEPGDHAEVAVRLVPPANIVASDYKITVKVTSDQTEKSDDFRIVVHEQSLVAIFGVALLAIIGGGVYYVFRKYNRR